MSTQLPTLFTESQLPEALVADVDAARRFAGAAKSDATLRAYASDWRIYEAWCQGHGLDTLPASAEQIAVFIAAEAERGTAVSTLVRRVAAIGYHHKRAGHIAPTARDGAGRLAEVLAGIRRELGRPPNRKRATRANVLREMIETREGFTLRPLRNRAILALGMAAALRRSEIVALEVGDLRFVDEGAELFIGKSKTDQERRGATIAIPDGNRLKPLVHVRAWLEAAGHADGPLFRRLTRHDELMEASMSDRAIARLVQSAAADVGLDPRMFGGHSLRAGFLTEAARARATIPKMQDVSRHKTVSVLLDYVRSAELFDDHAGSSFL